MCWRFQQKALPLSRNSLAASRITLQLILMNHSRMFASRLMREGHISLIALRPPPIRPRGCANSWLLSLLEGKSPGSRAGTCKAKIRRRSRFCSPGRVLSIAVWGASFTIPSLHSARPWTNALKSCIPTWNSHCKRCCFPSQAFHLPWTKLHTLSPRCLHSSMPWPSCGAHGE